MLRRRFDGVLLGLYFLICDRTFSNEKEFDDISTKLEPTECRTQFSTVVLNLFHCWDPLNATDVVWDPQVKIEKVCAPE